MIIINFYKQIETSWEELKVKAIQEVENYEKHLIANPIPVVLALEECSDYKKAASLGLRTFILQIINDWSKSEEPIQYFQDNFFQRFNIIELDGFLKDQVKVDKIDSPKEIFDLLKKSDIKVSLDNFEQIHSLYELNPKVFCDIIEVQYELIETEEFSEYEGKTLSKYHDGIPEDDEEDYDNDDDDLEEFY
jgi:hypothetical protein